MMCEPTTFPFCTISWPLALSLKNNCASPVTTNGYTIPNRTVVAIVISTEVIKFFFMAILSSHPYARDEHIDQLDPDERHNDAAHTIDPEIAAQEDGSS